ncbi:ubiquitin-conjugating enzyme E2 D2B-like [Stomoxys calcitrans]|uniref:UBC core domain-containing protein n=1 Tax=Stomoxys calcitrans TaxID=35570 RepID=A0A1I8PU80_STOCA|nr:ubiquitin-conjugating enzyme E2 D2B-like [Stomoxys calcitrans]
MNSDRIKKMRLPMEIKQLELSFKDHGIKCSTLQQTPDNYDNMEVVMPGPKGSPYEDGIFRISVNCGDQYPFRPPTFKFVTPVFHPNIDSSGKICLDLLRMPPTGTYNPAITLESILLSIQLLLANPNPDDPLQGDAADLYKSNNNLFNKKARETVLKYCKNVKICENDVSSDTSTDFHKEGTSSKDDKGPKRLKLSCLK